MKIISVKNNVHYNDIVIIVDNKFSIDDVAKEILYTNNHDFIEFHYTIANRTIIYDIERELNNLFSSISKHIIEKFNTNFYNILKQIRLERKIRESIIKSHIKIVEYEVELFQHERMLNRFENTNSERVVALIDNTFNR
jgi:hypothetical protein